MADTITSVIIASAQSVAKVFVIGGVGYASVLFPRKAPLLPRHLVGNVARFTFHALSIPLIYSTISVAVTIESLGDYWFVIVGGFVVIAMSYIIATITKFCFPIANPKDFCALRIAAAFPNIVALPILIFPSLCEFPVVNEGFIAHDPDDFSPKDLEQQCVAQSNTMVFCYFFSWSFAFWSFGYPQLMDAAKRRIEQDEKEANEASAHLSDINTHASDVTEHGDNDEPATIQETTSEEKAPTNENVESLDAESSADHQETTITSSSADNTNITRTSDDSNQSDNNKICKCFKTFLHALKQTTTSPGFITMVLAFITACIPPLQQALFEGGGPLRFIGSALETLGTASSPLSTMVVAAALVPPRPQHEEEDHHPSSEDEDNDRDLNENNGLGHDLDENPAMSDPNFGPLRRRRANYSRRAQIQSLRQSLRRSSIRMLNAVPRSSPEMRRIHIWFCLSRLVVTPAVVIGFMVALDCGAGLLHQVPNLALLVLIINSALPGALIVIVMLKSHDEMASTAAAVAKVYLPSYILSILSIAAWTALGLWLTLPDEDGLTVCQRVYAG